MISGGASVIAARKVRAKLITIASHLLEAASDDIVLENGAARVAGTDRAVPIATLARAAYHQSHRFKGEIEPAYLRAPPTIRPARSPMPATSPSSRSMPRPGT